MGGYGEVQAGDCIVAFSRRDIYAIKQYIEQVGEKLDNSALPVIVEQRACCGGRSPKSGCMLPCQLEHSPAPTLTRCTAGDEAPRLRCVRCSAP